MVSVNIKIQGMACGHCKQAVESAIKSLPGVSRVEVDLDSGQAHITYDDNLLSRAQLDDAIRTAGYTPL